MRTITRVIAAVAAVMFVGACGSAPPEPRTITVTFIRHAQSEGNVSGFIDTTVPGPSLTDKGRQEAEAVAEELGVNDYDGIYASAMVRTQQTAEAMKAELDESINVLPGLNEINAGLAEGKPNDEGAAIYMVAPMAWLQGDRDSRIPGSVSGNEFNDAFTGAVQKIYDSGDDNPVAYSSGASIMFWTMMNVINPDDDLITGSSLPNTGYVVIQGSPTNGWTLVNWNGQEVGVSEAA
jgi:broad specificity phosphatase PhoE